MVDFYDYMLWYINIVDTTEVDETGIRCSNYNDDKDDNYDEGKCIAGDDRRCSLSLLLFHHLHHVHINLLNSSLSSSSES